MSEPKVNIFGAASLWWWEIVFPSRRTSSKTPLILRSARGYRQRAGAVRAFHATVKAWPRVFRGVR